MPDDDKDKGKYGEENYKAMGSPMFTKLWTFHELETVERPTGRVGSRKKNVERDFKRPDNWPDDTQVEPGTWVRWLPEGWAQGIRTQALSGKKLTCYFNPAGKRFWHKKDIEKFLGQVLPDGKPPPRNEEKADDEEGRKTRYITDADAIPNWPDDEEDWLPKDFKIAFRQLPSGLHRVYIPPGYEEEGFLYHRSTVMDWLAGKVNTVSPFGSSRPMAEISALAAEKGTGGAHKKKRRHEGEPQAASPNLFEDATTMGVVRLEGASHVDALKKANVQNAEKLATDAKKLQEVLSTRSFEDISLLYVFQTGEPHPVTVSIAGFYYKRSSGWNEHDAYQKICLASQASAGVACSALHLCWSTTWEGHWKIGRMDSDSLGKGYLAFCQDSSMKSGWRLPRKDLIRSTASPSSSKSAG